jgi:hypothetical protein
MGQAKIGARLLLTQKFLTVSAPANHPLSFRRVLSTP